MLAPTAAPTSKTAPSAAPASLLFEPELELERELELLEEPTTYPNQKLSLELEREDEEELSLVSGGIPIVSIFCCYR